MTKAKCRHNNCRERPISLSEFCWEHIEDKDAYRENLIKHIQKNNSIKDFYLRKAKIPELDFVNTDCSRADFTSCNLSGGNFSGADMRHCNLTHADLKNAYLDNTDLQEAHLLGCDLSKARLWHANLQGANLAEANLSGCDLLNADFSLAKFWNVNIEGAKFLTKHNFARRPGRFFTGYAIDDTGPISAAEGYRNLKQYFMSEGRYDDSSWASFKEKQMQRKKLLREGNIAYAPSLLMGLMCGYGEKPYRVILFSIAVIFIYAILYFATASIDVPFSAGGNAGFWDCLYFSIVTFTTLGYGDITPRTVPLFRMAAGTEAFIGAFMMGLFVFTLARRYSAR